MSPPSATVPEASGFVLPLDAHPFPHPSPQLSALPTVYGKVHRPWVWRTSSERTCPGAALPTTLSLAPTAWLRLDPEQWSISFQK